MYTAKNVKIIPATLNLFTSAPKLFPDKRKVAAYARVSTDKEEQVTSYEAQVDYYTRYIKSRQDWEFVDIYTDEGISATSTKKRDGFNRMIQDALDGKIDLIVTKSVSRFARNTVDTLTTVRKLKDKGVEVYFEKENIYTLDSKGELLITIMGSLAQEESRSISENTTWGRRKRFADGKVTMAYKRFLGYEKGEDGAPKVVEKEAKIVKLIYQMFLEGKSIRNIAATLTKQKIPTPANKVKWSVSTITSILKNEKYKGDALLQKSYTTDFLTKKIKKNEGEVPQYYVKNSHPEIISHEIFDMVQQEFKKREGIKNRSGNNMFSSKIVCGDCGNFYGSKVWHSNDKYRRIIWRCNHKYKNEKRCQTPIIREVQIKEKFVDVINRLIQDKTSVIADCEKIIAELRDTSTIENKELKLKAEQNVLYNSMKELVNQMAHPKNVNAGIEGKNIEINQNRELPAQALRQYENLKNQYEKNNEKLDKLKNMKLEWKVKKQQTLEFLEKIKNQNNLITDFDEHMWYALVEKVIVNRDGTLKFELKNGQILS
nr:MAG TPA: integrase [Caudoviricetes sp.]